MTDTARPRSCKRTYSNANWDLVDAVDGNGNFLEEAGDDALPAELRGKTLAEKKKIVAENAAKRAELKARIARLEAERAKFLATELAKQNGAAVQSLETELMKATKSTATKKGYKF